MGMDHAATCKKRKRGAAFGSTEEYEETGRLGVGGYGYVVKARHRETGEVVAMKKLEGGREQELLREARALQACDGHPSIVGFRGLVRDSATRDLCVVMECAGPSLRDFLLGRRHGRLPESMVRCFMRQLLTGAKKIHGEHIIHRDIKPQNILVGGDGSVVKICDFGLAMSLSEPPPYEPSGTLWYMAPEMLLEMPEFDALVDIWSLGCVMAEMITGRALFQGWYYEGQLCAIFDVLGVPDDETWPGFSSTPFATEVLAELDVQRHNSLRELFHEETLSREGFQVLSGLLACNPYKRLTATAALKQPWFAKVDEPAPPRKEGVAASFPKKGSHKRQKLQQFIWTRNCDGSECLCATFVILAWWLYWLPDRIGRLHSDCLEVMGIVKSGIPPQSGLL